MSAALKYEQEEDDGASKPLVLVVDDDARTARRLALMLRDDGYEAEVATDGAVAIARLSRAPSPQLLITDLNMPHADGASVIQYARSRTPDIPVIVVTGHPQMAGSLSTLRPTPTIMPKPADYEDILQSIADALT